MHTPMECIPDEFKKPLGKWYKAAERIIDTGEISDMRFVPRVGTNQELTWHNFYTIANDQVITDWHKKSLCTWLLWSSFEGVYYEYD